MTGAVEDVGRGGTTAEVRQLREMVEALRSQLEESEATGVANVQAAVQQSTGAIGQLEATVQALRARLEEEDARTSATRCTPSATGSSTTGGATGIARFARSPRH